MQARYETDWCASEEGKGRDVSLPSPRIAEASQDPDRRGQSVRGADPLPKSGVHYFELTYSMPHRPAGSRPVGGWHNHFNNTPFGIIGPGAPSDMYSTCT